MKGTILILGATSGIARALANEFASRGDDLILAGRDETELQALAADLRIRRQVGVEVRPFDALAFETHPAFFSACSADSLKGLVLCYGYLGDQAKAERDPDEARRIIDTNYTSAASVLHLAAAYFEAQRSGFICVIGSVAGDRGRQSNYVYGSAKGALALFAQGLRNRLHRSGVRVLTVKPGFVDTGMTYGLPGLFLVAAPERVAKRIVQAVDKGADVLYVPWFWALIMLIIRSVPERLFKRLKL